MTIAVALSDSPRGKAALQLAAEEAQVRGQSLQVLSIIPGVDEPGPTDAALVERVGAQLADFPELTWEVHSAPEGFDTAEALLDLAENVKASMLVIGSRHRSAVGKLLLGSTVQRVLLDSTIPVLVVKAN